MIEKNEFQQAKIMVSTHFSFLDGNKNKLSDFIYLVKYLYPNENEKIKENYIYKNNNYKLRDKISYTLNNAGNIILEKFLSDKDSTIITYKYDDKNNLIEKNYGSQLEKYQYTKYDKFNNWTEMIRFHSNENYNSSTNTL